MHQRGDESSIRKKMPQGVVRHNGRGRSRTGCLTCIERHIRCDERRPYCRNCAKAGRQCKRRDPATEQRSTSKVQIWTLDNRFGDSGVSYLSLRLPDISDVARRSAFEFERLVQKTPISQLCAGTIAQSYSPRYYHLATLYPCVRYALVGAAGYGHFKATGTIESQEIGIRYTTSAISHLQTEIDNFSQQNADAILTTATVFATAAQDWDTWIIYVEGVSTVVKRMKESGYASIFPLMFEKLFSFWHFPTDILSDSNQKTVLADSFTAMRLQVTRIIGSIFALKNVIGIDQWSSAGFAEFEKLASIVHETLSLSSSTEMFWGFRLLRYWMLWFPVTVADRKDHLTQVLSAHFYLLLLSVARVFPERYAPSLERLCVKLIGEVLNNVEEEFRSDLSLRLVENTLGSLLGGD